MPCLKTGREIKAERPKHARQVGSAARSLPRLQYQVSLHWLPCSVCPQACIPFLCLLQLPPHQPQPPCLCSHLASRPAPAKRSTHTLLNTPAECVCSGECLPVTEVAALPYCRIRQHCLPCRRRRHKRLRLLGAGFIIPTLNRARRHSSAGTSEHKIHSSSLGCRWSFCGGAIAGKGICTSRCAGRQRLAASDSLLLPGKG